MTISDNLGDMLARIKNAYMAGNKTAMAQFSKEKEATLKVLVEKAIIGKYQVKEEGLKKILLIELMIDKGYHDLTIKRISTPGRRIYLGSKKIYKVKGGKGFLIISTPKGIMDGESAKKQKLGGELLAQIFN